jgi:hypothetical protein
MRSLNKAFKEYGEQIKEFQWLIYLNDKTGDVEFPLTPELDPFIQMGWLKPIGDRVLIKDEDGFFIDKIMDMVEIKPRVEKRPRIRNPTKLDDVQDYLKKILTLPADIHINKKYYFQISALCEKFSSPLVLSVASWYDMNRSLLPKEYQNIRYEQFVHHGMFNALQKWMTDGVPAAIDEEIDFRNRVC